MALEKTLPFIKYCLCGYYEYSISDKASEDIVRFVQTWTDLISEIQFCKNIHDTFQDFDSFVVAPINKLIKTGNQDGLTIKKMDEEWNICRKFYIDKIELIVAQLSDKENRSNYTKITSMENTTINLPLDLEAKIIYVNDAYPKLIRELNQFITIYDDLNELASDKKIDDFENQAKDLIMTYKSAFRRADKMIFNFIPIMTYIHSSLLPIRSNCL